MKNPGHFWMEINTPKTTEKSGRSRMGRTLSLGQVAEAVSAIAISIDVSCRLSSIGISLVFKGFLSL